MEHEGLFPPSQNSEHEEVMDRSPLVRVWFYSLLGMYFGLHVLIRTSMTDTLGLDEAEQAFLTQWLLLGYGSNPPLYTWLQIGFNHIFGLNIFSLALLKNLLLFATYVCVFECGGILFKNNLLAALAAASLMLVPQIGWESQRALTHSVLVTMLSAAAVYLTVMLVRDQRTSRYILIGALFGLGMISKFNFALFVFALLAVLAIHKRTRSMFKGKRVLWIPVLVILVALPYYGWFLQHLETASGSVHKFQFVDSAGLLPGTWELFAALISFLTPFWLVFALFFLPSRKVSSPFQSSSNDFVKMFHTYCLLVLGLFLAGIAVFHITEIKSRWLQPLFFAFPLYLFSLVDFNQVSKKVQKGYLSVVATAAGAVLLLIPLRVVLGPAFDYRTNFHVPYAALASHLETKGLSDGLIVTTGSTIGGNLRLHLSGFTIVDPIMARQILNRPLNTHDVAAIVWDAQEYAQDQLPNHIVHLLGREAAFFLDPHNICSVDFPYTYSKKSEPKHSFCYLLGGKN